MSSNDFQRESYLLFTWVMFLILFIAFLEVAIGSHDEQQMPMIAVVTLQRSGSSLMMKILKQLGVLVHYDAELEQEYKKDIAYSPTRRVTPKIWFTKKATQNCVAFVDLFLYEN